MSEHEVAYLGPKASYTHQAALDLFDSADTRFSPQVTIDDVFTSVQAGSCTFGVVPFENSTNGAVTFTLDLLADRRNKHPDIHVCGETYIAVHHCLLGRRRSSKSASDRWDQSRLFPVPFGDRHASPDNPSTQILSPDSAITSPGGVTPTVSSPFPASSSTKPVASISHITRLYSHPQAWGQCKTFMSQYLKGTDRIDTSSTSAAAAAVANDETGTSAAVCSALAAKVYGLDVLAKEVEDSTGNTTRFLVLQRAGTTIPVPRLRASSPPARRTRRRSSVNRLDHQTEQKTAVGGTTRYKSCIAFTVPYAKTRAGALASTLSVFAEHGINLTSINTRPSGGEIKWHYIFFVEFDGRAGDGGVVDDALRRVDELLCGRQGDGRQGSRGGGVKRQDGSAEASSDDEGLIGWWRLIGSWESRT